MTRGLAAGAAVALALFASTVPAPAAAPPDPPRRIGWSVPFTLIDNRVFVPVLVNGRPYSFVVDTGGVNALSARAANELGLAVTGGRASTGANAKSLPSGTAAVHEFRLGARVLHDAPFLVADFSELAAHIGFRSFDGIVGYETLENHRVTFDYARSQLTFDADPAPGAHVLPMRMWGNIPVVTAQIDGRRGEMLLDTGDRSSVTLFTPFAQAHYPRAERTLRDVVTGFGLVAPIVADVGRLRTLRLGDETVPGPVVRFATQHAGGFASDAVAGSIGAGVLERFRVTFDYVRGALELEDRSPPAPAFEYDRSGTWLSRDGTAIRVDDVVPGGPAAQAGIARGDRIIAVDGTAAESVDLPELRRRLTLPRTASVRFAIVRDSRPFTADLAPRKLV